MTLPAGERRLAALDQPPVHAQVGSAQMQHLLHLRSLARRAGGDRAQRAVDRHPFGEAPGIHHDRPHRRGRRRDHDGARDDASPRPSRIERLPLAQRVLDRRVEAVQAHAAGARERARRRRAGRRRGWPSAGRAARVGVLLTRAANAVPSAPNALGSGVDRSGGEAAARRCARSSRRRRAPPGPRCRATRRSIPRRRRGRGEVGDGVALVDRLRAEAPPRRQRHHRQPLDQAHDRAERPRARADHDRRAQRDARRARRRAGCRSTSARLARCAERAPPRRQQAAEVDDPPHAARAAAAAANRRAASRSRSTKLAGPAGSIEWIR